MDKNAVAFIRNDVRTLTVAFIDSEKGSTNTVDAEGLRQRALPYQKYTYLTIDPSIQPGDWVLVEVYGYIKAAYVVTASADLDIEPNAPVAYRFVVGRVDLTAYQQLLAQNAAISQMINESYKETIRKGFRETLLSGLPQEKLSSISLILNQE
jgi:hypothetical protein